MGYSYFASGGVLKGVMKSVNLYILSGDTIIGTCAISSATTVTSDN
jgi:hypothetical protein